MWATLLSPTGILAALVVGLSISNVLFVKLYGNAKDEYAKYHANVVAAQEQAEEAAQHLRAEHERLLGIYGDAWSRSLAARPAVRVLPAGSCLPQAGAVPTTSGQPAATSAEQRLDTAVSIAAEDCERRIENAITDAAQVRYLQQWILDQHGVSK